MDGGELDVMNVKKQKMKDKIIDILNDNLYLELSNDGYEIYGQYDTADEIMKLFNYNENESVWHD